MRTLMRLGVVFLATGCLMGGCGGGRAGAGGTGGMGGEAGRAGGDGTGSGAGGGGGDGGAVDAATPIDAPVTKDGDSLPDGAGTANDASATDLAPGTTTSPALANFRLSYSTAGYDARGTKMVLLRTLTPITVSDVSVADSGWSLKDTSGAIVRSGAITYFGTTYGIQYWTADFSSFKTDGTYTMVVTLNKDSGTGIGVKETLPFMVQTDNFSKTMLIPLTLNNADARKGSATLGGYYDATSIAFQEAYSHAIFLYGLLQTYKYKYGVMTSTDQARLVTDINIAYDHLLRRWSPDATTLFAHPEGPPRGGMNDIEPIYAMALYIDMFKTLDPTRASADNFNKVVTGFNLLKAAPVGWQDTGYQEYKDYLIPVAVHLYRYSGDVQWKNEAITRLNAFLSTFNLRTHYRGSARGIPLFDGLRACLEEFPTDPGRDTWISQARALKDTYYRSAKIWTANVFHIINTSAATNPAGDWDASRLTGDMWGSLQKGYTGGIYASDAVILAKATGDASLEALAAGELGWDLGLNPGIPHQSIANPTATDDRESASFIINAPFRHVTGVTYRDFMMANDTYMTLVNGFNSNGSPNEFDYVGTVSYNGEDFIKHDGCLIVGALMYEDYLASQL